jgi:hypothetical protein
MHSMTIERPGWTIEGTDDALTLRISPELRARMTGAQRFAVRVIFEANIAGLLPDWDRLFAVGTMHEVAQESGRRLLAVGRG